MTDQRRLRQRIIESTVMLDHADALALVGVDELANALSIVFEDRTLFPRFQFDGEARRIWPAMTRLRELQPSGMSDYYLLHWLTRPHLNFDYSPAEAMADEDKVVEAFGREIEPKTHG